MGGAGFRRGSRGVMRQVGSKPWGRSGSAFQTSPAKRGAVWTQAPRPAAWAARRRFWTAMAVLRASPEARRVAALVEEGGSGGGAAFVHGEDEDGGVGEGFGVVEEVGGLLCQERGGGGEARGEGAFDGGDEVAGCGRDRGRR